MASWRNSCWGGGDLLVRLDERQQNSGRHLSRNSWQPNRTGIGVVLGGLCSSTCGSLHHLEAPLMVPHNSVPPPEAGLRSLKGHVCVAFISRPSQAQPVIWRLHTEAGSQCGPLLSQSEPHRKSDSSPQRQMKKKKKLPFIFHDSEPLER